MDFYDAEVSIQDVNLLNAKIFEEGWMYVGSPGGKSAPLYFAPYFTRQGSNSGITMMSRVLHTEEVVLANDPDAYSDQTREEHNRKWERGLEYAQEAGQERGLGQRSSRSALLPG